MFETNSVSAQTNVVKPVPSTTDCSGNAPGVVTGALAPAFEVSASNYKFGVKSAIKEAQSLGKNYKAMAGVFAFANVGVTPRFYGYGSGKPKTATIRTAIPHNRLDVVMPTNVSGHDFKNDLEHRQDRLEARAKVDRYNITVTYPDGTKLEVNNIVCTGDLSTVIPFSIPNMQPGLTVIETWPNKSCGPGGYIEGRRLEIDWQPPANQR